MNFDRPIIINATPRSGSSMTAGIFQRHGLWAGTCREKHKSHPKGVWENYAIKRLQVRWFGHMRDFPNVQFKPGFKDAVFEAITEDGYRGERWMYKQSALYMPAFEEFRPYMIGVRREKQWDAATDGTKSYFGTRQPGVIRAFIDKHNEFIDQCPVIVSPDEVIQGEYRTLKQAFDYCELDFDPEKAREIVMPEQWHHSA